MNGFDKRYITVAEAAKRMGVTTTTIYFWIKRGKITAIKPTPHQIRVDTHELKR